MKVEYSRRATADLRKVGADSRAFGEAVAAAVEARIRKTVERIAEGPEAAPRVVERPGVRVVPLVRYPYRIFYRFSKIGFGYSTSAMSRAGRGRERA